MVNASRHKIRKKTFINHEHEENIPPPSGSYDLLRSLNGWMNQALESRFVAKTQRIRENRIFMGVLRISIVIHQLHSKYYGSFSMS